MSLLDSSTSSKMTTFSTSSETFNSYETNSSATIEDKDLDVVDSDEDSLHLSLIDEEVEGNRSINLQGSINNETEDDILNKFDHNSECLVGEIDNKLEDKLLNDDKNENSKGILSDNVKMKNEICEEKIIEENQINNIDDINQKKINDVNNINEQINNVENDQYEAINEKKDEDENIPKVKEQKKDYEKNTNIENNDENDQTINRKHLEEKYEKNNWKHDERDEDSLKIINIEGNVVQDDQENLNDFLKNQSDDSDDLMSVSIVRDAAEDNAEKELKEAELNNEEDDEDGQSSDKTVEDEEEISIREEMELLRNEEVNIIDENKNDSDNESCDKTITYEEKEQNKLNVQFDDNEITNNEHCSIDNNLLCNVNSVNNSLSNKISSGIFKNNENLDKEQEQDREINQINENIKKRPYSKITIEFDKDTIVKKQKLETTEEIENQDHDVNKLFKKIALSSLKEFIKSKNQNELGLKDLEEFCIEKICETIVYKSPLGEIQHQFKVYELTIESMRKDIMQLTKQVRDLEIVNKKLINDLKQQAQNGTQKLLQPLRITRSVGLQVKFSVQDAVKKKQLVISNKTQPSSSSPVNKVAKVGTQNSIPQRQTCTISSKTKTSMLSQALVNRRNSTTQQKPPVQTKTPEKNANVIDLTDEDEKIRAASNTSRLVTSQRSNNIVRSPLTSQNVRLTTQNKAPGVQTMVTTSSPQLMYVVQQANPSVLGSNQKAVFLNLQPTNGVLAPGLNGQSVSVISTKQSNTYQLKAVPTSTKQLTSLHHQTNLGTRSNKGKNKHPGPLPIPPIIIVANEKSLKSIPPKPVLTIRKTDNGMNGIILQWRMPYDLDLYETIASYQLYAYQETNSAPSTDMWRKVGDVKALALPMACTLTQFAENNKYYFAVRAVDVHKRMGSFSDYEEISL